MNEDLLQLRFYNQKKSNLTVIRLTKGGDYYYHGLLQQSTVHLPPYTHRATS